MKPPLRRTWLRKLNNKRKQRKLRELFLESLEDRRVMAVIDWTGDIPDGTVWRSGDVQRIVGQVRIPAGSTVTAEPGTIVKFNHFTFNLTISGTFNAAGTAVAPIVFTEIRDDFGGDTNNDGSNSSPGRGNWGQILIGEGGIAVIENAQIRYGGFGTLGQLVVDQGTLALRNSSISDSAVDGVRIQKSDPILANNRYERNFDAAISMDLASNPAISGVTLVNNTINGLQVDGGTLAKNGLWNDSDIVYVISGDITVPANTKLTVGPSQIVKFGHFTHDLFVNGTLDAQSPNASPIVFTEYRDDVGGDTNNNGTSSPSNGNWGRIELNGPTNVLRNVEVRYGGFGSTGALEVKGSSLNYSDGKVFGSSAAGVRIESSNPTISNVQFSNSIGSAMSMDLQSNPVITGNGSPILATGNGVNGLLVDSGTVTVNAFWDDPDVVYVTNGDITVAANVKLTVGAGQVVKFGHFTYDLFVKGTIDSRGSSTAPIVFTEFRDDVGGDTNNNANASAPGQGNWGRIDLAGPDNVLDFVQLRYGGYDAQGQLTIDQGTLTLRNSTISDSSVDGLRIQKSDPILSNNRFERNADAAVSIDLASNPAISGVTLVNNTINGLQVDGGTLVKDGFWNDPDIVYVTTGDITVPANTKLTIGPAQIVKFGHFTFDLIILGALDAQSPSASPIVFTEYRDDIGGDTNNNGANSVPGNGNWGRIELAGSAANVLRNVEARYGGYASSGSIVVKGSNLNYIDGKVLGSIAAGVRIETSNPTIANVQFTNNSGAALSMDLVSNPMIAGSGGSISATGNGVNGLLLDAGTISTNAFWDDPDVVYVTNGDITVATNTKLTVGPKQVIKFGHFTYDLFVNGTLDAQSPNAASIVFTEYRDDIGGDTNNNGASSAPGHGNWGRIELTGLANVMRNVEIRYGGNASLGSLVVNGGSLSISDGTVLASSSAGMRIEASNPTISNVQFTNNNRAALSMDLLSNPMIKGNSGPLAVTGNGINGLLLDGGTVSANAFWDDPDVVYVTTEDITIAPNVKLTVGQGQVVKFSHFTYDLFVNGTLDARGTVAAPIVFTELRDDTGGDTNNNANASGAGRGNWGRLELAGPNNVLENVQIRYGGFNSPAALNVVRGGVIVTGGTIEESSTAGVRLVGNGIGLTGVRVQNNSGAAISLDLDSNPVLTGLTLNNNAVNGALLDAGFVYCRAVWDDSTIPYVLSGDVTVPRGSILEIAPGQVVKAGSGHEIVVDGRLLVHGSPTQPVVLTSLRDDTALGDTNNNGTSTAGNGDWTGIRLTSASNNNELIYTEVRFAGDNGVGAIVVDAGKLSMNNSIIRNSSSRGLTARNSAAVTAASDLIYANSDTAIQLESGAQATIFNATIDSNRRGVVAIDANAVLTNSLVTNHTRSGVFVSGVGTVTASFNDVFNPSASNGNYEGLPNPTGSNSNISANPQYVDVAARNYELASGSPAIDSATSTGAPTTDLRNRSRVDDLSVPNTGLGSIAFVDRGALERQTGVGGEPEAAISTTLVGEGTSVSIHDVVANSHSPWINRFNLLDVNDDGFTSAIDVLHIVNDINSLGSRLLPAQRLSGQSYVDVNGDLFVSPIDALFIINELNTGLSPEVFTFVEQGAFATEVVRAIAVGGSGVRHLRMEVKSAFNNAAVDSRVPDKLLLYLVDPANRSNTLIDNGRAGTPFFSWDGKTAEYPAGVVRFDGRYIDIDLNARGSAMQGSLIAQFLNSDSDTGGRAFVRVISNQLEATGVTAPQLVAQSTAINPAGTLNTSVLVESSNLTAVIDNIRFDSTTGRYAAELTVRNDGPAIGRQVAVAFVGLPDGVTLTNPTGTLADGTPYLSLRNAIVPGGLASGSVTQRILVEIDNPSRLRFSLVQRLLIGGVNEPPALSSIPTLTVTPGGRLETKLVASDPDGDPVKFNILTKSALPNTVLEADGTLVIAPRSNQLGTFTFTVEASDGALAANRQITLNVVADTKTTTRVSGVIHTIDQTPLAGIRVEIGAVQGLTQADGSFTLDLGSGPVVADTLKVRGELFTGGSVYPFIAEKLPLVLEHDLMLGVNNVIDRPIYLPALNVAGGTTINPTQNTTVSQEFAPGQTAKVVVAAGTLMNQQGTPFSGVLSITQVPANLTPAALPANLIPSTVVTIQPGEMVFATPAPLTLPNNEGWSPGTTMSLWSINPTTGQFDNVGTGRVSADGRSIETVSGGIRNSSWHFFTATISEPVDPQQDPANIYEGCEECIAAAEVNSQVELHSGAVLETHSTVPYQSQGLSRSFNLMYDSLRADPRPIVHVSYADVDPSIYSVPSALRLTAKLSVSRGNLKQELPGYTGTLPGLTGGEHFWALPSGRGSLTAGLQIDLRGQPSGRYAYDLTSGVLGYAGTRGFIGTSKTQAGSLTIVNSIDSPFGAGWGMAELQEIVENPDGSVQIISGDGSELLFDAPTTPGAAYKSPPGDYSTLVKLTNGTFRRTIKDQSVDSFNAQHRIQEMRDRNGNVTRVIYDNDNVVAKIIDPVGLETTFVRTGKHITAIVDPSGRSTQLTYDGAGNLSRITDPDGTQRTFGYDGEHRLTSEIDKRGFREESTYDFAGRLVSAKRKDGSVVNVQPLQVQGLFKPDATIDPFAAPQAIRRGAAQAGFADGRGHVIQTTLDGAGQVAAQVDSLGKLPGVRRNDQNRITSLSDSRGHATGYTYDAQGNVVRTVDEISAAGLLALYTFEGDARDVTGGGHDGSVSGASIDVGYEGSGFRFDGINDFIELPLNINASLHPQLTMGAWVKVDNSLPIRQVLSQTDGCFDRSIGIDSRGDASGWSAFSGTGEVLGAQPVSIGKWTFIAAVYDQTANLVTFYVDDKKLSEAGTLDDGFSTVRIGASPIFGEYLAGTVDNVFFFADALTDAQIQSIRSGGAGAVLGAVLGGSSMAYEPKFSQPVQSTDELGRQTLYSVDANTGNTDSITQVVGSPGGVDDVVTRMAYDAQGLLATMTSPNGDVTQFDRDSQGRPTKITFAAGTPAAESQQFEYDPAGNTTAITDANGNRTQFQYDLHSRLTRVTEADPDGVGPLTAPVTSMTYDANGNLTQMTDALGRQTRFAYDALDRMIERIDPAGKVESMRYDADGNMVSMIDKLGRETRYRYDARGRKIEQIDSLSGVWRWRYDLDGNLIAETDANGHTTTYSYDARRRLTRIVDALGGVTSYRYDLADQLIAMTDANGRTTQYTYDELGRRTSERDPLGGELKYQYDANGNLLAVSDELNRITRYAYDQRDRVVSITNPLNAVMSFQYDAVGNLIRITDELNRSTQFNYDGLNRWITRTDQLGGQVSMVYDAVDNIVQVTDELSRNYQFAYDSLDRTISKTDPLGHIWTNVYDAVGNTLRTADPLGHGLDFTYDALDRPVQQKDSRGGVTSYAYDAVGNILKLTDPLKNVMRYQHDALDRKTSETDAFGKSRSFTYDSVGNLTTTTDRNGRVRKYTYDALDRQIQETWLDTTGKPIRTLQLAFDLASQLTSASDPDSAYSYTYDADGRVATASNTGTVGAPSVVFSYAYDAVDNLLSRRDSVDSQTRGVNSHTYDALNRLTRLTQSGSGIVDKRVDMVYDAASQLIGMNRFADLAGGQPVVSSVYSYDLAGRLTGLAHSKGSISLAGYTWTFDNADRITGFGSPDGMTTYSYDTTDQLTNADHASQTDEAYVYDLNGNRANSGYQTATANRLMTDGVFSYQYDSEGNRTRRIGISNGEVTEYEWDYRNRLTRLSTKSAAGVLIADVRYTYDVFDRRIAKLVDLDGAGSQAAVVERFIYDGDNIAMSFDGLGNESHRYLHGLAIDQILADEGANDTVLWTLTDNLSSVRDLVDSTGVVRNHIVYSSFGQPLSESNPNIDCLFAFAGRELDLESGLYFNRARYYDPQTGRFLSIDPVPSRIGDPSSANEYQYGRNMPTKYTDPLGLAPSVPTIQPPAEVIAGVSPMAGLRNLREMFSNLMVALDNSQYAIRQGQQPLYDVRALVRGLNDYWNAIKQQVQVIKNLPPELRNLRPLPPAPPPVDPIRKCPTQRMPRPSGQPHGTGTRPVPQVTPGTQPPKGPPTQPVAQTPPSANPPKPPPRGPSGSSFNPDVNRPPLGSRIAAGIRGGLGRLAQGARRILPWVGPAVVTYQVTTAAPENRPHVAASGVGGILGGLGGAGLVGIFISGPVGWGGGLLILGGSLAGGYVGSSIGGSFVPPPNHRR